MNGRLNGKVNGRVPRYHRIAEALRERIRGGELAPGTRLPNQRGLARSFGVTLMTLRQALEVLEREQLIARRHGLGTFVAGPSVDYDILQLQRFAGDLSAKGERVDTRLLGSRPALADRRVADALRMVRGNARDLLLPEPDSEELRFPLFCVAHRFACSLLRSTGRCSGSIQSRKSDPLGTSKGKRSGFPPSGAALICCCALL